MKIIIIGTHGHGGIVLNALRGRGDVEVVGFLDDSVPKDTVTDFGWITLGGVEDAAKYPDCLMFVAVGDNAGRRSVVKRLEPISNLAMTVIHPSAACAVWSVIDRGVFVGAGASVGTRCSVDEFSIINTHASLDHDSHLGKYSHLAPGVTTGGHVTIGDNTFIGLGAMVRDRVKIGNNCTVGMGSVVLKDIPDNSVAWGNPCKIQP